jgi:hypothetical protein
MGLDFKYKKNGEYIFDELKFSYFGFYIFRETIAKVCDIDLQRMEGFCQEHWCKKECENCKKYKSLIKWEKIDNNIKILLNHSDVEGKIVLSDLEKLLPQLKDIYNKATYYDSLYKKKFNRDLLNFINLVEKCIINKSDLIFT